MGNILDYLDWRGDLTFEQSPFNEVDNLILSCFSYLDLDEITELKNGDTLCIKDLSERFSTEKKEQDMKAESAFLQNTPVLLEKMARSKRFRECIVGGFVNEILSRQAQQFAAVMIGLGDGTSYISFRGTDDTIVGWKEDFNLSNGVVPSHRKALEYLEEHGTYLQSMLRIGGHSKGGNLAVYASVFARPSVKKRIITVYNNDGPGFDSNFVKHPDYLAILPRIKSIVPYCSVVGMLLNHDGDYEVVKSSQSGLMQHDSMSWQVIGPDFETEQDLSPKSKRLNTALSAWIDGLTREQRAEFVDTLFSLVTASGAKNLSEISTVRFKNVNAVLKSFRKLDKSERAMILKIFASLTGEIGKAYKNN